MKTAQVKTILLVCCGQGFNKEYRGRYNRYKVLIDNEPIENVYTAEELKSLPYWSNRSKVMAMTTWGQSQEFVAKIKLARFLNLGGDLKDWEKFADKATTEIKAIY